LTQIAMIVVGYLVGSIPFAYLLVRSTGRGDIRLQGSGNVGATNALRSAGWKVAVLVAVLDVAKGALAVWLMGRLTANPVWITAAGVAAVIGHCFPVWLRFAGGKGVATAAGAFVMLAPLALLGVAGVWVVVLGLSRYVSLASVLSAASFPVSYYLVQRPSPAIVTLAAVASLVIIWRHRSNLARLVRGEEPRMGRGRRR
jgi:acyl phosphate:glycerol-3-phosphate acyltransferase